MRISRAMLVCLLAVPAIGARAADWAAPIPPMIPGALGYVPIPDVAVAPNPSRVYKAIFDTTRAASRADQPLDGVLFAATDLSALRGQGVPLTNTRLALIIHGRAIGGTLDNTHYRSKFGVDNPNLPMLASLRKAGVEIFVCGQSLFATQTDPAILSPDVTVASEAYIVLISYQNDGYAVIPF
jgi:intracellular sulfur oxidation DsrE/DsrF family protein